MHELGVRSGARVLGAGGQVERVGGGEHDGVSAAEEALAEVADDLLDQRINTRGVSTRGVAERPRAVHARRHGVVGRDLAERSRP